MGRKSKKLAYVDGGLGEGEGFLEDCGYFVGLDILVLAGIFTGGLVS